MKTIKYAQTFGHRSFNWAEALSAENISTRKWSNLKLRAVSWITCACGNQCSIIPRFEDGMPEDYLLQYLGKKFYLNIAAKDNLEALKILELIELRSTQLISQINSKQS